MGEFTEIEKLRLMHAVFPDEYDNPDGPHCQIKTVEGGGRICVADDHTLARSGEPTDE